VSVAGGIAAAVSVIPMLATSTAFVSTASASEIASSPPPQALIPIANREMINIVFARFFFIFAYFFT
jgi:hypothetical protein